MDALPSSVVDLKSWSVSLGIPQKIDKEKNPKDYIRNMPKKGAILSLMVGVGALYMFMKRDVRASASMMQQNVKHVRKMLEQVAKEKETYSKEVAESIKTATAAKQSQTPPPPPPPPPPPSNGVGSGDGK